MNVKTRSAAYIAPVVLVVIGLWFAMWSPRAEAVVEAADRVDAASMQQARLGAMVASANKFAARGDEGQEALSLVRTAIPDKDELAAFVLFIDAAARSNGCIVRALNPQPIGTVTKAPGGLTGIGIDMSVLGSIEAVQAFLAALATLPRAAVVDELQISQESDQLVEMSLVLRIFRTAAV